MVAELLENPDIDHFAKVKILLMFALRYEGEAKITKFESSLVKQGIPPEQIEFIRVVLEYAGKEQRSPLLFQKARNILGTGINFVTSQFKDV